MSPVEIILITNSRTLDDPGVFNSCAAVDLSWNPIFRLKSVTCSLSVRVVYCHIISISVQWILGYIGPWQIQLLEPLLSRKKGWVWALKWDSVCTLLWSNQSSNAAPERYGLYQIRLTTWNITWLYAENSTGNSSSLFPVHHCCVLVGTVLSVNESMNSVVQVVRKSLRV